MKIKIKDRGGKSPEIFTHAVLVDDVAVGYGDEQSMSRVVKKLELNPSLALELKEEFRNEPEEW